MKSRRSEGQNGFGYQAAFGRMDAGDVHSGEAFALRVQQILLWIALTSDIEKALDQHSAQRLSALMSETFASLGSPA